MNGCAIVTDLGVVRDVLTAVSCNTRDFARLGYESLTAAQSPFQNILTTLLTIYVALIGYRLLFATGNARLSDGPGIALKIGTVLALVTSWSVFETLVFDIAARAPVEIARVISAPLRGHNSLATDPIRGLQIAYDRLSAASTALDKAPAAPKVGAPVDATRIDAENAGHAAAARTLSLASGTLFTVGAGLICIATIIIGVLTAIGPVFIALFLFFETRGFFVGWVRALVGAALSLTSTWTLNVLMLSAMEPWLIALAKRDITGYPDSQVAVATSAIVFVFAASQVGMLLAGIAISHGFQLHFLRRGSAQGTRPDRDADTLLTAQERMSRPARLAEQLQRQVTSTPWLDRSARSTEALRDAKPMLPAGSFSAARTEDLYRRPAVTRDGIARRRNGE